MWRLLFDISRRVELVGGVKVGIFPQLLTEENVGAFYRYKSGDVVGNKYTAKGRILKKHQLLFPRLP
jgi:hypothetical protein